MSEVRATRKATALLLLGAAAYAFGQEQPGSDRCEVKPQLAVIGLRTNGPEVARLFGSGTRCLPQLVAALSDPNTKVSSNAAAILGYLADPKGMEALEPWLATPGRRVNFWSQPIPAPLREADFARIERSLSSLGPTDRPPDAVEYSVWPLAIDGSARAQALLRRIGAIAQQRKKDSWWDVLAYDLDLASRQDVSKPIRAKNAVSAVGKSLFFVRPNGRENVKLKLVAEDTTGNLALVEVDNGCGGFCNGWYHVVVRREGESWRLVSVTEVAVS